MEQQIANLPPTALITFGAVLAVIFAVRYLGLWQGQKASPANSPASAQVAAVVPNNDMLMHETFAIADDRITASTQKALAESCAAY